MVNGEKHFSKNEKDFSTIIIENIIDKVSSSIKSTGRCIMAISGGRTPIIVYKEIIKPKYAKVIDWSKLHILFTDERCVGKNHSENNFFNCYKNWLQYYPGISYSRIKSWWPPQITSKNYESLIKNKFSEIDIIFMGMGEDGHVASLFPDYDFQNTSNFKLVEPIFHKKSNTFRITMTTKLLNSAKTRIFGIVGSKKKDVFMDLEKGNYRDYPIQYLINRNCKDKWILL